MGKGNLRNQKCGCGSGKKFSDCCELKQNKITTKLRTIGEAVNKILVEIQKKHGKLGVIRIRVKDYSEEVRIAYIPYICDLAEIKYNFNVGTKEGIEAFYIDERPMNELYEVKELENE